jgi:hypothetical protein
VRDEAFYGEDELITSDDGTRLAFFLGSSRNRRLRSDPNVDR